MQNLHTAGVLAAGLGLALASAAALAGPERAPAAGPDVTPTTSIQRGQTMADHPYVGLWVTDDGRVRHALLANGRYDEARGARESAYQGRYEVAGTHIDYWDDTGFTADGTFVSLTELHHGGMILRRRI
jgi:hypothetical protein